MKVDKELVKKVADLARLELSDKEVEKFVPELKDILNAFSKLDEVDTKDVKPSFQPVELKNLMREEKVEECLNQDKALENSENKKDGYFKGPRAV